MFNAYSPSTPSPAFPVARQYADVYSPRPTAFAQPQDRQMPPLLAMQGPSTRGPLATDQESYDKAQAAKNRAEWWKSGILAAGALGASGVLGVGLDFGLKWIAPHFAATIQTAIGPAWWGVIGAVSGALTYLFIQKVTEPVGAWVSKWSSKGSPIQSTDNAEITKEFIDANQGANSADSRALAGAAAANMFESTMQETMRAVREQLEHAEVVGGRRAVIATNRAAQYLGRKLISTEVLNFSVVPDFKRTFELLHLALGAPFETMSDQQKQDFINATVEVVRAKRPHYADPRIPQLDQAITGYYRPVLENIVIGRTSAMLQPRRAMMAQRPRGFVGQAYAR
jgi:hypothetical protein